jgi:hypothetical protein
VRYYLFSLKQKSDFKPGTWGMAGSWHGCCGKLQCYPAWSQNRWLILWHMPSLCQLWSLTTTRRIRANLVARGSRHRVWTRYCRGSHPRTMQTEYESVLIDKEGSMWWRRRRKWVWWYQCVPGDHFPYFRMERYGMYSAQKGSGLCSTSVYKKDEHVCSLLVQNSML